MRYLSFNMFHAIIFLLAVVCQSHSVYTRDIEHRMDRYPSIYHSSYRMKNDYITGGSKQMIKKLKDFPKNILKNLNIVLNRMVDNFARRIKYNIVIGTKGNTQIIPVDKNPIPKA